MRHVTASRPAIAWVLLGGQILIASGCHTWQTQTGSAESILAAKPQNIRIATKSQPTMTEVTGPRVTNDSLYGMVAGSEQPVGVSLADVTAVQIQHASTGRTVGLVAGITVAAVIAAALISYDVVCDGYAC